MPKRHVAIIAVVLLCALSVLAAPEVRLTALSMQSGKSFELAFGKASLAPSRASMSAALGYDNGQASIKLSFRRMEPAMNARTGDPLRPMRIPATTAIPTSVVLRRNVG